MRESIGLACVQVPERTHNVLQRYRRHFLACHLPIPFLTLFVAHQRIHAGFRHQPIPDFSVDNAGNSRFGLVWSGVAPFDRALYGFVVVIQVLTASGLLHQIARFSQLVYAVEIDANTFIPQRDNALNSYGRDHFTAMLAGHQIDRRESFFR